jgi:hypothetical protein
MKSSEKKIKGRKKGIKNNIIFFFTIIISFITKDIHMVINIGK